jgi:choline kinase
MINTLIVCPEITRGMKSVGSKCLLKLKKNLTLIEYQISQAQKIKPSLITINIGFDADNIKNKLSRYTTINFLINKQYEKTNQAKNLIDYIHKFNPHNLLVISSGLMIKNHPITKYHLKNNCKIFTIDKNKQNFEIGCSNGSNVEYLFYDMEQQWSEIFFLNHEAINVLKKLNRTKFNQMYLFEVINILLNNKIVFEKVEINKKNIMKLNGLQDLASAKTFV